MADLHWEYEGNALGIWPSALSKAQDRHRANLNTVDENGNVIHDVHATPGDAPGGMFAVGAGSPSTPRRQDMKIHDKDLQGIWQAISNLHVVNHPDDALGAARDGKFSTGENFMWGVSPESPSGEMWAISVDRTGFTISNSEGDEETWFVAVTSPNHAIKLILNGEFFKALFS